MVVVGLNKSLSLFINEQTSSFDEEKQVYIIEFVDGTQLEMERKGIKKNIEKYVNEHKEELENALHQAERLQAIKTNEEKKEIKKDFFDFVDEEVKKEIDFVDEDVSNQAERLQAETQVAVFNNIPVSRLQAFFTVENIGILEKLIEIEKRAVIVDHSNIPDHYRKLSNNKSVSIRMNEEIYNKMKLHSIEIGESIATITNFIFDMYLKEMKK